MMIRDTNPEHDTDDAEDDGDETGVIDGQILLGNSLLDEGLRRQWLTGIVCRCCIPVR